MKNFFRKRLDIMHPLDAGRKLNKHETFRRCSRRLLGVLLTLNLRPVFSGHACQNF